MRTNNFDLLRLLAASQVVWFHAINNLEIADPAPWLSAVLKLFPGVPVFFVISGYLISLSYERTRRLRDYAANRCLRIYPALILCFLATLGMLTAFGVWREIELPLSKLLTWIAMQLTVGQFYSPHILNQAYGVGHTNGSLWTITVELQFYVAIPLLYVALRRMTRSAGDLLILVLASASYALSVLWRPADEDLRLLALVSCLPWLYMFLGGVWLQRNRERIAPWIEGKGLHWLAAYVLLAALYGAPGLRVPLLLYIPLALAVVSLAHTAPGLSDRLLRRNDVSYGVYIYHMVVVNALWEMGARGLPEALPVVFLFTFALAWLSWRLIERPALALKRRSLRPVEEGARDAGGSRADGVA